MINFDIYKISSSKLPNPNLYKYNTIVIYVAHPDNYKIDPDPIIELTKVIWEKAEIVDSRGISRYVWAVKNSRITADFSQWR